MGVRSNQVEGEAKWRQPSADGSQIEFNQVRREAKWEGEIKWGQPSVEGQLSMRGQANRATAKWGEANQL